MEKARKEKLLSYIDIITGNMSKQLKQSLVPMEEADLQQVWIMRNDPQVRKFSQSDQEISWEEFESTFKYTTYPKLVFKTNEIVGYVEFRNDMIDDIINVKEWSFFVAPQHRNKGWSEIMLDLAIDYAREQEYDYIRGIVNADNEISHRLHQKLGFETTKDNRDETVYMLKL